MKKSIKILLGLALILLMAQGILAAQVLKRGNGGEPATLDPHYASGTWENYIIGDMFMGLTTYAADGKLLPGLAESWKISADGKVYTFKLRSGLVWSDGKPITAQDFLFSLRRIMDPKTASRYAFILYPIKNAPEINKGELSVDMLGVKAINSSTLEITLLNSVPYFLEQLTHYTSWAIPEHVVTKHGKDWTKKENIVVSGAFKLEEWRVQTLIRLVKNPKFFDAKNVKLEAVEFYPIEDANSELNRYRSGGLHFTASIPAGQVTRLKKDFGKELKISPYLGIYYYPVNTKLPKLKNVQVRKALSLGINRDIITQKILGEGQISAYSFVPPSVNNYVPFGKQARVAGYNRSYKRNIAEAKKLMTEAGFSASNPLELELKYNTDEGHKKIAIAVAAMWKQIYVKTKLFNQEVKVHYKNLQDAQFEIGRAGWIGDYNDPTTFTDIFLESDYNYGRFFDPKAAQLSKQASRITDLKKRATVLAELEKVGLSGYGKIPIYYYVSKHIVSKKVKGWEPNIVDTHRSRWISIR